MREGVRLGTKMVIASCSGRKSLVPSCIAIDAGHKVQQKIMNALRASLSRDYHHWRAARNFRMACNIPRP